jgi:hypothetical protein
MKLTIKSVNGNPACSNYFVDEHTKLSPGEYIELDGRAGYNKKMLEPVDDDEAEGMKAIELGNAAPTVDIASQGHTAQTEKLAQDDAE